MSVYASGDLGIVRFIGHVQFAEGVWLGVELKKPSEPSFYHYIIKIITQTCFHVNIKSIEKLNFTA